MRPWHIVMLHWTVESPARTWHVVMHHWVELNLRWGLGMVSCFIEQLSLRWGIAILSCFIEQLSLPDNWLDLSAFLWWGRPSLDLLTSWNVSLSNVFIKASLTIWTRNVVKVLCARGWGQSSDITPFSLHCRHLASILQWLDKFLMFLSPATLLWLCLVSLKIDSANHAFEWTSQTCKQTQRDALT